MSVASVTCDRCGTEIRDPAERTLLHVMCGPLRSRRAATDLCPECASAWLEWVEQGPDAAPPAKLAPPSPRPAPVHRPHAPHAAPTPVLV